MPREVGHTILVALPRRKWTLDEPYERAAQTARLGRMLFQVALYVLVYLICFVVCAKVPSRQVRQLVLLAGSYALYVSWGAWFALVLLASTIVNYLVGFRLRRKPEAPILVLGILLNLILLATFKYLPEAASSLPSSSLQRFAHLAMPLGISFWTFQAISYLFDLYREEELDPTFVEFATYMAFFPVVISGPVCRMTEMLPQFRSERRASWEAFGNGFRRIATGVLMVQLARLLGQGMMGGGGVSGGFDQATHWGGADVWFLSLGFGLQLFFDFAGYTHIVIGAAQGLGFTLPENFDRPFRSTTPSIFWTRWHMSLSFWIRDYVFLPMAMMRREVWWRNLALFASMVLFGVWHKATILFVIWGAYHGVLLVSHRLIQQGARKWNLETSAPIWTPISWVATMALISLGWVFFRANSLDQARQMFAAIIDPASYQVHGLSGSFYALVVVLALGYGCTLLLGEAMAKATDQDATPGFAATLARHRWFWIPPLYLTLLVILLVLNAGRGASAADFMYRGF